MAQHRRLELQSLFENLLGSRNVYFQPPESTKMIYPCIVYQRDSAISKFADNNPYNHAMRYQVTHIDRDPDSEVPDAIAKLPLCVFTRHFTADNLNHDVYNLYF